MASYANLPVWQERDGSVHYEKLVLECSAEGKFNRENANKYSYAFKGLDGFWTIDREFATEPDGVTTRFRKGKIYKLGLSTRPKSGSNDVWLNIERIEETDEPVTQLQSAPQAPQDGVPASGGAFTPEGNYMDETALRIGLAVHLKARLDATANAIAAGVVTGEQLEERIAADDEYVRQYGSMFVPHFSAVGETEAEPEPTPEAPSDEGIPEDELPW